MLYILSQVLDKYDFEYIKSKIINFLYITNF